MNLTVLVGAALLFATTLDDRIKRRRSLRELHVFRSIAHVIDMHQLTKDPSSILDDGPPTESSPQRTMSKYELGRYLDYCSEMLSLTSKLAALYAQVLPDGVVIDAVNEIENLTANFSRKIWQKISIIESYSATSAAATIAVMNRFRPRRHRPRSRPLPICDAGEGGAPAYLEGRLKAAGFAVHRVTLSEPGAADVENPTPADMPAARTMLAGHTDVVPPGDEAAWSHPPFAADVADGMLSTVAPPT